MASGQVFCVLAIVLVGESWAAFNQQLPPSSLGDLTNGGATFLAKEIQRLEKAYNDSVAAFIPRNNSCNRLVKGKLDACKACVTTACMKRAKDACAPSGFAAILGQGIQLFSKDIPHFFTDTVKGVFVDSIGGTVVNVGHELESLISNTIPNLAIDVGKVIGNGAIDIGKNIGNSVVDLGKTLTGGVVDVGKTVIDGVKNIGGDIHKIIGHLIGRRDVAAGVRIGARAASAPGCDAIKSDSGKACAYYIKSCSSCTVDPNKDCSGFADAINRVKAANNARAWLAKASKYTYQVKSVNLDPASFDGHTQGYTRVEATVAILGKELTFRMSKPVNPFNPTTCATDIAQQALQLFKA